MKKTLLLILLIALSVNLFAQNEIKNSEKKLRLGISLGLNCSNLIVDESNFPTNAEVSNAVGFQLGILADYQFSKYFSVSPRVNISFNEGEIITRRNGGVSKYPVMPLALDFSTYLAFKKPIGTVKPYFFVGPTYKAPLTKQRTITDDFPTGSDLAIDFGIGLEKVFKHFSFAPELRYSYGLRSVNENPILTPFTLHQVSLVFNFLG